MESEQKVDSTAIGKNLAISSHSPEYDAELAADYSKYLKDAIVQPVGFQSSFNSDGPSISSIPSNRGRDFDLRTRSVNRLTNDRIQLVPNDRDIPNFLLDDIEEILGIPRSERTSSLHSKGVQTRISGVRTISSLLHTNDFVHPTSIMSSATHPRDHPSSCISYGSELSLTRSQLYNVHRNYQKLKSRFHKLHEDYYKLLRVAGELTTALDNSAHGNPVDLPNTLKSCMAVYPDLFSNNVRDDSMEIKSLKSEIELQHHDLTESRQPILGIVPISSKELDFKKIKFHLINGSVKTKLLLLQALRWKITLSQPAERDETIHEYTSSDLLGLNGQIANDNGKPILPYLLIPLDVVLPHPLQQSAARLLNTLASLRCGRDYLSVGPSVLNVVVQCLDTARAETVDAFTCDMILAMLQKMSLRRQQRLYMIGMGLVEWLIYHLKSEKNKIGTYRLEYTTALLMNLSLHREAQIRAATMTNLVLSTLTELLYSSHLPALSYVNGTLNNFLANRTINEEAKKIGLDAVLEYHRQRNSGEIRRHLDHILNRHRRDSNESIGDNTVMADDDSEELDVLENELDELDPVKVHAGELFGEALLATCYSTAPQNNRIFGYDTKLLSPESQKTEGPVTVKDPRNEAAEKIDEAPGHEKLRSPSSSIPRLTSSSCKLTRKNTTTLKTVEFSKYFATIEPVSPSELSPKMTRQSIDTIGTVETWSESEIGFSVDISGSNKSLNPGYYAISNKGIVSPVNSTTALIATYESAAQGNEGISSAASLKIEHEIIDETDESQSREKIEGDGDDADDDAFVSKPLISRTPPRSAGMDTFTAKNENKIDDDSFEE